MSPSAPTATQHSSHSLGSIATSLEKYWFVSFIMETLYYERVPTAKHISIWKVTHALYSDHQVALWPKNYSKTPQFCGTIVLGQPPFCRLTSSKGNKGDKWPFGGVWETVSLCRLWDWSAHRLLQIFTHKRVFKRRTFKKLMQMMMMMIAILSYLCRLRWRWWLQVYY